MADVVSFLRDDEDLHPETVGSEDSMSDGEARRGWDKVYATVAAAADADKPAVRKAVYVWVCKNSTSTRSSHASTVVANGRTVKMSLLFDGNTVPIELFRKFMRAPCNVIELEAVARHPSMAVTMRRVALERGVKPDLAVASIDIADKFKLTVEERAEFVRVKSAVLPNAAPVLAPAVAKIGGTAEGAEATQVSMAPAPTPFGVHGRR